MSEAILKYTFAPLSSFWNGFNHVCEVAGYSRAASNLARLGYHEEAKRCMMEIKKLKQQR